MGTVKNKYIDKTWNFVLLCVIGITLTLQLEYADANYIRVVNNVANDDINVANDDTNVANDDTNVANDDELTDLDKAIYKFITSNKNASTKEIAEAVKYTVRSVQRSVKTLEKHQIIKKVGTRNNIEWIILK